MSKYSAKELAALLDAEIIDMWMLSLDEAVAVEEYRAEEAAAFERYIAAQEAAWNDAEHQAYIDDLCAHSNA